MPEQPEKLNLASADVVNGQKAKLRELFPEVITEGGKVDFERLKLTLGETVDTGKERYGMNWPGKAECFKTIQQPSVATLLPVRSESVEFDTTENLIIEGDNLEVLKLLQKSYLGKVKLIYIDPPYNTGNDFIYPDNYTESLDTYLRYTGQVDSEGRKYSTNTEADGRFHTKWLNMMYPRLYLARNLLRDDGVIFISIDDHEVHNLRCLMNELFGEENFVAEIIWKKMDSPSRNAEDRAITEYHEYVIAYARNKEVMGISKENRASILDAYPLRLPDGRKARRRQLRKNGKGAKREDRPTMWFPLTTPDGTEVLPVAPEGWQGRWVLSKEAWEERTAKGLTEWIKREHGWMPYYIEIAPEDPTAPWSTLWDDVDQNRQAKAEYTELMGPAVSFQTPKPVSLMTRIVSMAADEDDIILDFFAGSGTTGQAVLELNKLDGGERKFVLVQLPEPTETKEYPTIADITKERVRRVIKKLNDEGAGKLALEGSETPDRGFKVFKLQTSNFKTWNADAPKQATALAQQLEMHVHHIIDGRTQEDLLYEILLKSGFPVSTRIEKLALEGKTIFSIADGAMLVCLENALTPEVIKAMADRKPERVVCLDEGFAGNDQLKTNAVQNMRARGVTSFKTI
jgi:adenine-specific DNA-methyltransferase